MQITTRYIFLFLLFINTANAQILEPAKWTNSLSRDSVQIGDEIWLIFRAVIPIKPWYLYSSDINPDLGPMVTEFAFEKNDSYSLIGEIIPINPQKKYDDIWKGEVALFERVGRALGKK
ncbi:MAG: hypothetical protein U5K79_04175 [Cyclobacteriaceae bacterium]|nr:hypothetical protein [Cyclobacteriaceae bacterium]